MTIITTTRRCRARERKAQSESRADAARRIIADATAALAIAKIDCDQERIVAEHARISGATTALAGIDPPLLAKIDPPGKMFRGR